MSTPVFDPRGSRSRAHPAWAALFGLLTSLAAVSAQAAAPVASNPTISGSPSVGAVLTGNYTYSDADGDPEGASIYQWVRYQRLGNTCFSFFSTVVGAGNQYTPTSADEGNCLVFRVTPVAQTGADGLLQGLTVTSPIFGPISANSPPTATGVTISGTPRIGQPLTGDYQYSDADGDPEGASTFRWLRDGAEIPGATGRQYTVVNEDSNREIVFEVTPIATTGANPGAAQRSAPVTVSNTAPVATAVSISGTPRVGQVLTGNYQYSDADGDEEGISTFRWYRGNSAISGATARQYTVVADDVGQLLAFEVTPVAKSGILEGGPVKSPSVEIENQPPTVAKKDDLVTEEDTPLELTIGNFTVTDPDTDPDDLTLHVMDGENYSRRGNTITPARNFTGTLTVPVQVRDGNSEPHSNIFNATVTVTPENDAPVIDDQNPDPLEVAEDTPITLSLENNFIVVDPDNEFPGDFTLTLLEGEDYTVAGNVVTPAENFNGNLVVGVVVTDAEGANSEEFGFRIKVTPVNDAPSVVEPIADFTAIENSALELDVSGNFTDVDGDDLIYTATWAPVQPPNLDFDGDTGEFSGTPLFEDTEAPGPVYTVTVTASDPDGESVQGSFQLIVSALDRANLALGIDVSPDSGEPGEQFQWTFTTTNPIGPQPGANVVLSGTFTGEGLTVTPQDAAACTVQVESTLVTAFECTVGAVAVDSSVPVVIFTTASGGSSEVLSIATAESIDSLPIDPNLADNTALLAVGIGTSFSMGAVQNVGAGNVLSLDAGDVNGDGRADLIVGTSAGLAVQVFLADEPRESCGCYRDYLPTALTIPNTGNVYGVKLADFTGDGILDLVAVTGDGQADVVYRNDGNGTFTELATLGLSSANAVAVADFNGDGNKDIAIAANGPNPVWLGDGAGGFTLETEIGGANSLDVAAGDVDGDGLADLVFANAAGISRIQRRLAAGGFLPSDAFNIGALSAVALGDINSDGSIDLIFGRSEGLNGGIPSNPVYLNNGNGGFGLQPVATLGLSPTRDVLIGDVTGDGAADLVFINASGVHQIWVWNGTALVLHEQQIIDVGGIAGVLGHFGEVAADDEGGLDLAIGGAQAAGAGVYLNDGTGNLGRGDTTAPTLELAGEDPLVLPSGGNFVDPGTVALDDIDGDISDSVVMTGSVNTAVVGSYTVTYNVTDFAGNAAAPVTRTVQVNPATGAGGGGGGSLSRHTIALLLWFLLAAGYCRHAGRVRRAVNSARYYREP